MSHGAAQAVNQALRFALELTALTVLSAWGWHTGNSQLERLGLAAGAPLLAATVWGQFVAPRASHYLSSPGRVLVEAAVFGAAALALVGLAHPQLAGAFALLAVLNTTLIHAWRQDVQARTGATARVAATARR